MKVTIIDRREFPSLQDGRQGKQDALIIFTTDTGLTSSFVLPSEQATEVAIRAEIQKQLTTRGQIVGKTLEF